MKAVILTSPGIENIMIEEKAKQPLKANEVHVKIGAMSLNYLDLFIAKGFVPVPLSYILGCDSAGVVDAVGEEVKNLKVGDRVSTHHMPLWQKGDIQETYTKLENRIIGGAFSEYLSLAENALVKAPDSLSLEEAATLPIAAVTAWEALFNVGRIRPGHRVLLQGTGGVSMFALQFAKSVGAKVLITSSSNEKLEKAKSLGADSTVNYKEFPDWHTKVLEFTEGKGVDIALEVVGTELNKTIQCVKIGGHIAIIGLVGGVSVDLKILDLLQRPMTIKVIEVGSKDTFEEMNKAIEANHIKPVISKVFPLSEIQEAFRYMEKGVHFGKVVIQF